MSSSSRLERLMLIVGMTDRLTGPLNRIQTTVSRVTNHARRAFMNTAAGVTALMAASSGFAATINPANDMNMALGEVRSLEVAENTLAQLNQAGLQYSIQFGESAQGYVRAAYDIQSAIDGLVNDDLPRFTTAGGTLAKATKANVGDITAYFGSMYGIFRNQANAMGKSNWVEMLAGRTATAVQMFKTTGPEMKAAFESLGADATSYGVSMAEQMAVLGNLQSTMSGSEAGTKYRAYLAGIAGAEQKLGLKFSDESGKLLPIVEVLNRIQGKFGDIDTLAKGDLLNKAFGSGEATAMLKLLSADIGKINGDITKLADTKGMGKAIWMAEQMQDPWARLNNGITAVSVAVYQKVLPAIKPFILWMVDGLSTLTRWTDKYPHLTKAVGLFAAGLFALVAIGGSVTLTMGLMQFAMAGFVSTAAGLKFVAAGFGLLSGGLLGAVSATWAFTAALLANPITWIVLAVVALIAGLAMLVIYWDEVSAAFMRFIDPIMPALELIGAAWNNFMTVLAYTNPFKLIGSAIDWLISKLNLIPGIDIDLSGSGTADLATEQRNELSNMQGLDNSTRAHVDQGGLMQTYNQSQSTRNNNKTNRVEKMEIHNHGEPVRGDQLLYEMEMMAP